MKRIINLKKRMLSGFICAAFSIFSANADVINCAKLKGDGQKKHGLFKIDARHLFCGTVDGNQAKGGHHVDSEKLIKKMQGNDVIWQTATLRLENPKIDDETGVITSQPIFIKSKVGAWVKKEVSNLFPLELTQEDVLENIRSMMTPHLDQVANKGQQLFCQSASPEGLPYAMRVVTGGKERSGQILISTAYPVRACSASDIIIDLRPGSKDSLVESISADSAMGRSPATYEDEFEGGEFEDPGFEGPEAPINEGDTPQTLLFEDGDRSVDSLEVDKVKHSSLKPSREKDYAGADRSCSSDSEEVE